MVAEQYKYVGELFEGVDVLFINYGLYDGQRLELRYTTNQYSYTKHKSYDQSYTSS